MTILDREILALMRRASEEAILPHYRRLADGDISAKAGDDVVTVADHASEDLLAEGLTKLNPAISIVGEEAAEADPSVMGALSSPCWIVDPLDGTNNFAIGKPPFGILVALAEDGETKSGWIYDCLSGRFCAAHLGGGAFIDGERVQAKTSKQNPPVAAISLLFMNRMQRERVMAHIAPHYRLVDIPRCAAEQYPRLALGENDVSVFERTLPWDHAAGALWLNEAGGRVARLDGRPYLVSEWDQPGLVGAASPALWDELAARLAALAD